MSAGVQPVADPGTDVWHVALGAAQSMFAAAEGEESRRAQQDVFGKVPLPS